MKSSRYFSLKQLARLITISAALHLTYSHLSAESTWRRITEDLYIIKTSSSVLEADIVAFKTSLKSLQPDVVRAKQFGKQRLSTKLMCKLSSCLVGINSNFFDENGDPLGLILSEGNTYNPLHKKGHVLTGVLQIGKDFISITNRDEKISTDSIIAIQAGPRLISNYNIIRQSSSADNKSMRAGVCIDSKNNLIIYATSQHIFGISITSLQKILLAEPFSCKDALNFDGGGSTQLFLNTEILQDNDVKIEIDLPGRDFVPVMFGPFRLPKKNS